MADWRNTRGPCPESPPLRNAAKDVETLLVRFLSETIVHETSKFALAKRRPSRFRTAASLKMAPLQLYRAKFGTNYVFVEL